MESTDTHVVPPAADGARSEHSEQPDTPEIAGFAIRGRLGEGGFAEVYLAERSADGRGVAIKVLRRHLSFDPTFRQRFLAELETTRALQHVSIVEVLEGGITTDGRPYIVMELLTGMTLTGLLAAKQRLEPREALAILEPVCAALELAHQRGIVHRDIKAANVMLIGEPPHQVVKLLDFGIAKVINPSAGDPRLTVTGVRVGSLNVMAPEQIRCQAVDARTDVYALGVLVYRLIVGSEPFRGDRQAVERMHLQHPPPRASASVPVPPSIDEVVLRCMDKDPARRYPSAAAVVEALRSAVGIAPAVVAHQREALILCVESRVDPSLDDDDDALEDMVSALELAEEEVREAGIAIEADTGNGFVACALLVEDPAERARQCASIVALLQRLHGRLEARPFTRQRHPVRIALHADRVTSVADARASTSAGGPGIVVSPAGRAAIGDADSDALTSLLRDPA